MSFYEVDSKWADSLLAEMSVEQKLNQLILMEADRIDSVSFSKTGGVIVNAPVDELINISNWNSRLSVPTFFGSKSVRFGGILADKSISLGNVFGASNESLDSLLSLEDTLARMLGINFYFQNPESVDTLFNAFQDNRPRFYKIEQTRLKSNFKSGIVHVSGNWHAPLNDTTPIKDTSAQSENRWVQQLVDSGMLAIGITDYQKSFDWSLNGLRKDMKKSLEFEGLIVSAPIEGNDTNQIVNAFMAGADLIHVKMKDSSGLYAFRKAIKDDIETSKINQTEVDNRVRKILLAKTWMKKRKDSVSREDYERSFAVRVKGMRRQLDKEAVVLVKNAKKRIPISNLLAPKPCLLKYGRASYRELYNHLNMYEELDASRVSKGGLNPSNYSRYGKVILVMHELLDSASHKDVLAMQRLDEQGKLILVNLDNPENLAWLKGFTTLLQVFGATKETEQRVAEAIYGGIGCSGKLPGSFGSFSAGHGLITSKTRLEYGIPEEAGMSADSLNKIRTIARQMIYSHTSPGCQVMAIKDGKVIYHEAFGHHTYDRKHPVSTEDVYDLASVTKITATTPAFMRFYEDTIFRLDDSLYRYLPDSLFRILKRRSSFHNVTFREMLLHRSGAPAGLKILPYIQYQNDSVGKWDACFCDVKQDCYDVALANGFYLDRDHLDSLWFMMNTTWLDPGKPYKYSDINMNMLYMLMKSKLNSQTFARFVDSTFYEPLGLKTLCYNPRENLDTLLHRIAPTEDDRFWRGGLLKGYVHDPTAALFGGEAGSAGLFGNVHDLGIFYQMLLNGGTYGGKRYLKESTVKLFTGHQNVGFRGLGFNKPTGQRSSTKSIDCPTTAYGHTGFTGICVWVDPDNDLIFIFASNRVHPSPTNNKINQTGVRSRMHQVLYDEILGPRSLRDSILVQ